jgi:hypothetical protein
MKSTLSSPSQLRRSNVLGRATRKEAAEKIARSDIAHSPLLDSVDKACCPERSSDPYAEEIFE